MTTFFGDFLSLIKLLVNSLMCPVGAKEGSEHGSRSIELFERHPGDLRKLNRVGRKAAFQPIVHDQMQVCATLRSAEMGGVG